jgi:hypothetical protein
MTVNDIEAHNAQVRATNKAVVTELFRTWQEGRFDRVAELLDPDGDWWTLAQRKTRKIRDQIPRNRAVWEEATEGIRFVVRILTAEEDRVSATVESYSRFAEQGEYNNFYHFLFRVQGGRIVDAKVYYDTALANRVLRGAGGGKPVESHRND